MGSPTANLGDESASILSAIYMSDPATGIWIDGISDVDAEDDENGTV